ncbi:MAG TPA: SprT family zinc-dependent metalloprotease [Bacillota bacterium]|nr:SprT family zinc-dependent metalloprotease [Bacillota bacterium]
MKHKYKLIRSNRKSLALEISRDLEVIVRAPKRLSSHVINRFVSDKEEWIEKNLELVANQRSKEATFALTDEQKAELKEKAKQVIPAKVEHYSDIMGLSPTGVKITSAEKRFGSCSSKNSLCFSYRLMLYPDEAIDYVVVHELAHIKHHNHSKAFYELVLKYMPDYKPRAAMLKHLGS